MTGSPYLLVLSRPAFLGRSASPSGGMATSPPQHAPIAVYRQEVSRSFFV